MKMLPLTQGKFTAVDDADFDWASGRKWYFKAGYAYSNRGTLHRLLLDVPKGLVVDHINGDGLDNRRSNLRICTQSDNMKNAKTRRDNRLFKGVRFDPRCPQRPYEARLTANGRCRSLGFFSTAEEAAKARDEEAKRLHGEFFSPSLKKGRTP